ncbi:DUF1462 family protein [Aureibacillus halotolerans]|uniref:Disulfide oxidoreductase YuzD n=1 Tax=Aureibacillus halotolerans TaxID=1508390 RepID=A0A4R6U6E0_9BACI|nr:DUF1462 family protein [Aureibacillus halotolerans]TDQ40433.1 disulfide oxidoreductase YuzD [Aureibacillus halotolerans]
MKQKASLLVIGRHAPCPSCVSSPSSVETHEWLNAAISRKFPDQPFESQYIDVDNQMELEEDIQAYVQAVLNDDYFYPLVVLNNTIVAEGVPRLKPIIKAFEDIGYVPQTDLRS